MLRDERNRWVMAWMALLGAAGLFLARGPMRAIAGGGDFAAPYAAAKALVTASNPYDQAVVTDILRAAGRERDAQGTPAATPSLYPPPALVILAPLAPLHWPAARLVWTGVLLLVFAVHVEALRRWSGLDWRRPEALLFLALMLAFAPYHTGIALGQLAIASACLMVVALAMLRQRPRIAGVLLGIAVVLKPQLTAPMLVFALALVRDARLPALGIIAGACLAGFGWLHWQGISWMDAWMRNARLESSGGDIDPLGPRWFHMIDLRTLLAQAGVPFPGIAAGATASALAAVLVARARHVERDVLLIAAAVAALTLLAGYHRFYDAAVLSLALAWSLVGIRRRPRQLPLAVLGCCAVFFVPGAVMLYRAAAGGMVPDVATGSTLWRLLVLPHQNWTLLLLTGLLFLAVHRLRRSPAGDTGAAAAARALASSPQTR